MVFKGRTVGATLLFLFLFGASTHCQQISSEPGIVTDRPDVTESSIVIPKGSVQFENGITWTMNPDKVIDFSETLLRVGLLNRTELRLVLPNYVADITRSSAPSGFSDIALGGKQQLGPFPGHFDLSVIAAVSLPTGGARISSHGFDPFVKFPWSKALGKSWSIAGMQSFFWNTQGGKRNPTLEATLNLERELTESWNLFAEYAGDFPHIGGSQQIAHFGTAYRITPNQQIDFHFGFGLSPSSAGDFFAVGYSIRLDNLTQRNTADSAERELSSTSQTR